MGGADFLTPWEALTFSHPTHRRCSLRHPLPLMRSTAIAAPFPASMLLGRVDADQHPAETLDIRRISKELMLISIRRD